MLRILQRLDSVFIAKTVSLGDCWPTQKRYISKLSAFVCVVGFDASPYDNMPLIEQKYRIYKNLAITAYFGMNGIKVIPNVRLGDEHTIDSLETYPKNTLIAIGTNGFMRIKQTRELFIVQFQQVLDYLRPSGVCIYGPLNEELSKSCEERSIPVYQYDSYTMTQNKNDKLRKGESVNER